MAKAAMHRHADHFLRVASGYPYVGEIGVTDIADDQAVLWMDLAVELPNAARLAGESDTGVRAVERVQVVLRGDYPRRCPSFRLRPDFPPAMPHLAPGDGKSPPVPCLVDGSPDEFFAQHDLVDAGIMAVVEQMCIWLKRAAIGTLANAAHGWEPINRDVVLHELVVDREHILAKRMGKDAGNVWLRSRFVKQLYQIDGEDTLYIWVGTGLAPKVGDTTPFPFGVATPTEPGNTVAAVLWPSQKAISQDILSDNVTTLGQLEARAEAYGMGDQFRQLLTDLERRFEREVVQSPIPVAVVLCVRRPFQLMGRASDVELLAYWFNLHRPSAPRPGPLVNKAAPVFPARQVDMPSPALFRHITDAPEIPATSIVGCGSVGSKLAIHLARTGTRILAVSDGGMLRPHNMARHGLARHPVPMFKAPELATELGHLGDAPESYVGNVIAALESPENLRRVIPDSAGLVVNTTASRLVREALSGAAGGKIKAKVAEVALFGRGNGAFVFLEGDAGRPSLTQLEATLYASMSPRERRLLFDPSTGLTQVQIGEGCGSLTMPMTDARLSAMTAMATEELVWATAPERTGTGHVAIGIRHDGGMTTSWRRITVPAFLRVPVEGGDWTLDIADDVVRRITDDIGQHHGVETGGLLIGTCNSRLRAITVVDVLPAPEDSTRSGALFMLGTKGLKKMVGQRFRDSGRSLFDVGTWHSHLADQGASALDWKTAKSLAAERPPPAVLLICTPKRFLAITGTNGH